MRRHEPTGTAPIRIAADNTHLLSDIAEDVFDDHIGRAQLKAYLAQPGHALYVVRLDGRVVGQVRGVLHHQPDRPVELYVDNLGVTPSCRRRGIARRLMQALVAWGRAQGSETVWLASEPENEDAWAFYNALGFESRTLVGFDADMDDLERL